MLFLNTAAIRIRYRSISTPKKSFGYRTYQNQTQYQKAMNALAEKIRELTEQGLAAAVYTQLTDVEEESNGILTYDRKVCKWEPQEAKDFCSKE